MPLTFMHPLNHYFWAAQCSYKWNNFGRSWLVLCFQICSILTFSYGTMFSIFTSVTLAIGVRTNSYTTRNTFCRTRSLSNATFSFLITWRSSSSKSAAVYKISWKSMIFHWDMAIYRFSKWWSSASAILELFYHHTRPPTKSVAGRSCLSNFMSI